MSNPRLELRDLTVSYGRVPAIHHLNLTVPCSCCVALLGPNGAGKTSLLKAIVGLVPYETGEVVFRAHAHTGPRRDFAYVPQRNALDWDFPITVRGFVETGCYARLGWWRWFGAEERRCVDAALAAMRLEDLADRQIRALSGGQQQRAFLARALAQEADVLLLDEPFTGLDKSAQETLSTLMRELAAQGRLVLASHHDLKSVPALFDEVILLNGELVAHGPTAEAFTETNIARTFGTAVFTGAHHAHGHHSHHPPHAAAKPVAATPLSTR